MRVCAVVLLTARWPSSVETWNRDEPERADELHVEAVELGALRAEILAQRDF